VRLGDLKAGAVFVDAGGEWWAVLWPPNSPPHVFCMALSDGHHTHLPAALEVTPVDVPALAREHAAMLAQLHDVSQDGGFRLGRDSMLAAALELVGEARLAVEHWPPGAAGGALDRLGAALRGLGTSREFPPDRLAAENDRLRAALRLVVEVVRGYADETAPLTPTVGQSRAAWQACLAALGGDPA
jgi:hypothetical protein